MNYPFQTCLALIHRPGQIEDLVGLVGIRTNDLDRVPSLNVLLVPDVPLIFLVEQNA